jgi:hypothetical protein
MDVFLFTTAQVLATIPQQAQLIKLDFKSGFFQIPIHSNYRRNYGLYYKGE